MDRRGTARRQPPRHRALALAHRRAPADVVDGREDSEPSVLGIVQTQA